MLGFKIFYLMDLFFVSEFFFVPGIFCVRLYVSNDPFGTNLIP